MSRLGRTFVCLLAFAGGARATSIFSYHHDGLGYWAVRGDARNMGMGAASAAIFDMDNPISINPAALGAFRQTSLTGTFLSQKRIARDRTGLDGTFYDQYPRILRAVVPLGFGIVTSVGLEPLTDVRMRWVSHTANAQLSYLDSLETNGGLWAATLQFGRRFGRFSAGLRLQLTKGNITTEWRRTILDDNAPLATSALLSRRFSGTTLGIGAMYRLTAHWTFGGGFDLPVTLDETVVSSLGTRIPSPYFPSHQDYSSLVSPDEDSTTAMTRTLPLGLYFGSSWKPNGNVLLATDVAFRRWSHLSSEFRNTWRLSLGAEIHPSTDYRSLLFLQWPYRFGVRWEQHYIPTRNAASKKTFPNGWFLTTGLGIPLGDQLGRIDYSFEYGKRGSLSANLARETVWRQTISLVGWERWFVRRPRR